MDSTGADPSLWASLPLMAPPAGQHSNFDAPAHDRTTILALTMLTIILAFVAVAMRVLVKLFVSKQRLSWDDGACLLALAAGIASAGVLFKDFDYGLGKQMWNVRAMSLTREKLVTMTSANFTICFNMLCVRISVLALYQQLFGHYVVSKKLIFAGYFIVALITIPELGVAIRRMAICTSASSADSEQKYCSMKSTSIAVITFAVVGVLVDVYIYSIAIYRLRALHISRKKKVQLTIVFGFGLIALVFGICNFVFCAAYFHTQQILWFAAWISLFKILEANIALTCACTTFFPALWKTGKLSTSLSSSKLSKGSKVLSVNQSNNAKPRTGNNRDSDEELVPVYRSAIN